MTLKTFAALLLAAHLAAGIPVAAFLQLPPRKEDGVLSHTEKIPFENRRIKVIGDSVAAGVGCSGAVTTDEVIFEEDGHTYYRVEAENSWTSRFARYLDQEGAGTELVNLGCSGAPTADIREHLDELVEPEDDIVFLLMGLNDRKRENGLEECRENVAAVIDTLREDGKTVVLFTPMPSTEENEHYANRLYHTEQIVEILRETAKEKHVPLVDHYRYVSSYLESNGISVEDAMTGGGCKNDGLHPSDFVQRLMFENTVKALDA